MRKTILLLIVAALVLVSCKSTKVIGGGETKTEYINTIARDTVRDSVITLREVLKHDSIFVRVEADGSKTTEIWHNVTSNADNQHSKDRVTIVRDTMRVVDSVRVPVPVERKLNKWETIKQEVGGLALGALSIIVVAFILYLYKRLRTYARGKL